MTYQISWNIACRTSTRSQSEITENHLLRLEHPPKVKYSYNNKQNISFQDHYKQHPPEVKYFLETVPKIVIKRIGDTAYDSYISQTLYPLKSAIKPKKQMRFAGDPVTSVRMIPARRTRSHPPKWTIKAGNPDLLIPIELSQVRAENDLNQDLRGNMSVMSPRESHHTEETLLTVPLGQFQAQRSDNTTTNSIAHFDIHTPSQSEINSTITEILYLTIPAHPPKDKYSLKQGQVQVPAKMCLTVMEAYLRNIHSAWEPNLSMGRPVTAVIIPRPQHPPKVKYFPVTITILIVRPIHPPKVK